MCGQVLSGKIPTRTDGYAPIADYASIGNQRTAALVALDGSIDWMCLPAFDSPSMFGAALDSRAGGSFALQPDVPFTAARRYMPDTNVLETTFSTDAGSCRVTDAFTIEGRERGVNEVVRRVEGLAGAVPMRWRIEARPRWSQERLELRCEHGVPVLLGAGATHVIRTWEAGTWQGDGNSLGARFEIADGETGLVALSSFEGQPPAVWPRRDLEWRLDQTAGFWRGLARRCEYDGPWREAVERSALTLHMLVYRETGAIVAAPTTSLPEAIGSGRNWDYRYSWLRDTSFTLDAMLRLGYRAQVHASLAWMAHATLHTHPRLRVFYGLHGEAREGEEELPLRGYRGSTPVRCGNAAASQLQLGNYGDLFETAWQYVRNGHLLDRDTGRRLAEVADFVCQIWTDREASIWELPDREHYTEGKFACWVALDRAIRLARRGQIPAGGVPRWSRTAAEVRRFIDERCWSDERRSFTRYAGTTQLDAAVLLLARGGYLERSDPRLHSTIDALRSELGHGPLLYRYSGMETEEGAFLACSFWLVEALVRAGRLAEADALMDELVGLSNDVGLYPEEIDPASGEFLGNFPQALSHLALINAAAAIAEAAGGH